MDDEDRNIFFNRVDWFAYLIQGCLRPRHELFRTLMKTTGMHILSYIKLYSVRTNLTSFFSLSSLYSIPSDGFRAVAASWSWVCSYDGIWGWRCGIRKTKQENRFQHGRTLRIRHTASVSMPIFISCRCMLSEGCRIFRWISSEVSVWGMPVWPELPTNTTKRRIVRAQRLVFLCSFRS